MVLKFTVCGPIRNVISFSYKPKTEWNSDIYNFLTQFSILAFISLKMGYDYDDTVTSYLKNLHLFSYVWERKTPSYTMVPITRIQGFHFQVRRGQ